MIKSGDSIGPYTLVRTIGRGAFGEVWLGEKRSTLLTTQVALKMPLVAETEIEAVRQEAALWLQASGHPNIVPVMDAEVYDGQVVIASEYIAGGSLHAWLEGNGGKAPSLEVAVTITNGILAGLDYLHRVGLTHRDLKPENILLQDGIPRLTDFGLARVLKTEAQTGNISGTPRYMAPETFSGSYSAASDLWAVGVLLHELLTGTHPFPTQELMALIIAIQSQEPAPLLDTIPERLRNIVTRLLSKSPVDRYVSASAVREALQNCLQPVAATPVVAADTSVLPSHNLPVQPTSFIGREKQIAELKGLLEHTCLLTLTGSGGCGKTRLSFQVAEEVLDRFADGVWLVELAPLADPAMVPQSVANVLGIREEPGAPLLQALIGALKTKSVLLILDNCEHLLSACAQFADAVLHACPQVKILASSREGLNIAGETVCRIPSLSFPESKHSLTPESLAQYEAVRLFVARATAALPAFRITPQNAMAVAQLCVRLDGIPLAIELAAARVRSLPVEQIEARLHDRFRLLTGGSRTALPRQQTLHALIQWSVDLLNDQEKALLRRLSVFAGGWSLAAAEKVCACEKIEEWEMLDLLTALVDKSLVAYEEQDGSARYRLLETVRQYALELLWESGEGDAVRMRHRDWFLQFAEEARPKLFSGEQIAYIRLLKAEHDNLRAALEWSGSDAAGAESGLRLTAALWRFWWDSGYLVEGMQRFEAALAHEGAAPHTHARAAALIGAGIMAQNHDELVEAERYYSESLAISQELKDEHGIATAIGKLGDVAMSRADNEVARRLLTEALVMHRRLDNLWDVGQILICLGVVASSQEDWDKARTCFEECYVVWRGLGDLRYSHALNNLSALDFRQSDLNGAQAKLEASLKVQEEAGDNWVIPRTLVRLGAVSAELGDYARGRSLLAKSVRQGMATGQRWVIIVGTEELAHLAAGDEQLERAARLYGAVDSLGEGKYPLNIGPPSHSKRAAVRDALGAKAFEGAWAEGRVMTMEQAVSYALLEAGS